MLKPRVAEVAFLGASTGRLTKHAAELSVPAPADAKR